MVINVNTIMINVNTMVAGNMAHSLLITFYERVASNFRKSAEWVVSQISRTP